MMCGIAQRQLQRREAAEEMEDEEGPNPKRGEGSEEDSEW